MNVGYMKSIPLSAAVLGWAGVLPFAGLSAVVHFDFNGLGASCEPLLIAYGAVILSFMGGVHWGLAMQESMVNDSNIQSSHLALSVVPALVGWLAIIVTTPTALVMLALAFLVLLIVDMVWASGRCAPAWYGRLRLQLSSAVLLCLVVAWASL